MRYLLVILLLSCGIVTSSKEIMSIDRTGFRYALFKYNRAQYRNADYAKEYAREYERLKLFFDENPELEVVVYGYQNNKELKGLAERRSLKVKDDLIKIGISSDRIYVLAEPTLFITDSMDKVEKVLTQKVELLLNNKKYCLLSSPCLRTV